MCLFLGILCLFCAGGFFIMACKIPLPDRMWGGHWILFIFFLAFGFALLFLAKYFRKLVERLPQRPIVRVWTHNSVTAVATEEDYQLWWKEHERYESLRGLMAMPVPHALNRPAPKFTMFFSNKSLKPIGSDWSNVLWSPDDWRTGNNDELAKLLNGCRIEKAELFVPQNTGNWVQAFTTPVSLEVAWELIHGPNATPPTK